jgi:hypothetical protein
MRNGAPLCGCLLNGEDPGFHPGIGGFDPRHPLHLRQQVSWSRPARVRASGAFVCSPHPGCLTWASCCTCSGGFSLATTAETTQGGLGRAAVAMAANIGACVANLGGLAQSGEHRAGSAAVAGSSPAVSTISFFQGQLARWRPFGKPGPIPAREIERPTEGKGSCVVAFPEAVWTPGFRCTETAREGSVGKRESQQGSFDSTPVRFRSAPPLHFAAEDELVESSGFHPGGSGFDSRRQYHFRSIAHLGERWYDMPEVPGSSPGRPTTLGE